MKDPIWSVSRGSGGFKASTEAVKVRTNNNDGYEVVFCTPVGVHNMGDFAYEDAAVAEAKSVARRKGFDMSEGGRA
jgi:hypothetical protein